MDALNFRLVDVAAVFAAQVESFTATAAIFDDMDLLDPSACRGWSRLELVVHVRAGLDEMAASAGMASAAAPSHDAASYWRAGVEQADDPVAVTMWLRRTASAYARPTLAVRHLADAATRAQAVAEAMPERPVHFQGKTLTAGDFLATWIVELAVHELDLDAASTPPGLALTRRTLEALAGAPLPQRWDHHLAVVAALGRVPWPAGTDPGGFPIAL